MPTPVALGTDPTRVGPYLIERKLGAGGMGTVYLARHEGTGNDVAVKILAPSLAREPGLVARFLREIDALKKLKNPHVVELYDHGVDSDFYYYAMEYVEGETLTARLRRERRLFWREAVQLSIQICVALKAAHDAGIIHRDLKPSNLLLSADGTVKLTDFGVAQIFAGSKLTVTGGIIGTAEYMSPEQAQGRRLTRRSDLYSLGAVMYVMLAGRPPFSGKTTLDVLQKHKYGQFDRPRLIVPDIPHWLDEIVCQLMEKDPDKRFADAYVVSRKLQEVLRKVEIATADLTEGEENYRSDASTVAVVSDSERGFQQGPGQGTLMRDLFRAEIERSKRRGDLRKLLESTWFLVAVLLLLVAGVAYSLRSGRVTPQQQFDRGVALLDENEEANWRTARDQYFNPLAALKSPEWDEKIEPYVARIRVEELKAALTPTGNRRAARARGLSGSDIEKFLSKALRQRDQGDLSGAERTLTALTAVLQGTPYDRQRQLAEDSLRSVREQLKRPPADRDVLDLALARADALAIGGKWSQAAEIWRGVIELYGSDNRAANAVARAQRHLNEHDSKPSQKRPR